MRVEQRTLSHFVQVPPMKGRKDGLRKEGRKVIGKDGFIDSINLIPAPIEDRARARGLIRDYS